MKDLTFKLRNKPRFPLDCHMIKPESFIGRSAEEIMDSSVMDGRNKWKIGDYFDVYGDISDSIEKIKNQRIVLEGDLSMMNRVGERMSGGEIIIKGNYGSRLGEFMHHGRIEVIGDAGSYIGTSMSGGEIIIKGRAGDYIGCARIGERKGMDKGKIIIEGDVGTEVGYGLTGGEIFIKGNVHSFVGCYMGCGKITLNGIKYPRIGNGMKGGKIYVENSNFRAPFNFKRVEIKDDFTIYAGDYSVNGKGRIFIMEG